MWPTFLYGFVVGLVVGCSVGVVLSGMLIAGARQEREDDEDDDREDPFDVGVTWDWQKEDCPGSPTNGKHKAPSLHSIARGETGCIWCGKDLEKDV